MKLLPCPFCGREANMTSGYTEDGDAKAIITCTHIGLSDGCCSIFAERADVATAERDAVKAWNTRAERTCKMEWSQFEHIEGHLSYCECSECGNRYSSAFYPAVGEYCMECGARVVGDE